MDKESLVANWNNLDDITKGRILCAAQEYLDKKNKAFVPMLGEPYFVADNYGDGVMPHLFRNNNTKVDKYNIGIGNCFRTKEEAVFAGTCSYYTSLFDTYVNRNSFPLDWSDPDQPKFFALYSFDELKRDKDVSYSYRPQGATYASSAIVLQAAIDFVGEENFLKYVLKVGK